MAFVLKTHHAILDLSSITVNALNVWITVLIAKVYSNAKLVLLVIKL